MVKHKYFWAILFFLVALVAIWLVSTLNLNNFPKPTGAFGVGKISYHLTDISRKETNIKVDSPRELMLHIHYPAATQAQGPCMFYDADALQNMKGFVHLLTKLPIWLLHGLDCTKTYAQINAPIANEQKTYPVILMLHGSGTMIQHYTWIGEELASHGYIVVGINHPYMAAVTRFLDDRVITSLVHQKKAEGEHISKAWKQEQFEVAVQDINFVINNLAMLNQQTTLAIHNKLDLEQIGICGHSSGGSLSMRMCLENKRIKAGISLDGNIRGSEGLVPFTTPFLVILAQKSHVHQGQDGQQNLEKLIQLCHKPDMQMTIMTFKGIGHGTFCDLPLLLHETFLTQFLSHIIDVDINASSSRARTAIKKAKSYMINFFDHYLRNQSTPLLVHQTCDMVVDID